MNSVQTMLSKQIIKRAISVTCKYCVCKFYIVEYNIYIIQGGTGGINLLKY